MLQKSQARPPAEVAKSLASFRPFVTSVVLAAVKEITGQVEREGGGGERERRGIDNFSEWRDEGTRYLPLKKAHLPVCFARSSSECFPTLRAATPTPTATPPTKRWSVPWG
jgi:hypothetical protein